MIPTSLLSSSFSYRNGTLCAEAMPVAEIAAEVDTPFYLYATEQLNKNYQTFAAPFAEMDAGIHFAVKACPNRAVIKTLAQAGAGADVTSVGELERALEAGVPPKKIVFSGVGKTRDEIMAALLAGIAQINAESLPEIARISEVATMIDKPAPLAIRLNPEVDVATIAKIATGHKGAKFGVLLEQTAEAVQMAATLPGLSFKGFSVHIGSHLEGYKSFRDGFERLASVVSLVRSQGIDVQTIDVGGGVSISYDGEEAPSFASYVDIVKEVIAPLGCHVIFEPGRFLVAEAGILVCRVQYVKDTPAGRFVIVDAGMNDLVRPAMYEARHSIVPVRAVATGESLKAATIVGPVCESSDTFGADYALPASIAAGDLLAVLQAGAYGSAMSSLYNARALAPEIMVSGARYATVRRRVSVAEQMSWETVPSWIGDAA